MWTQTYATKWGIYMGVHHGETGDKSPRIWSGRDANANCPPPQILSYRYKNERSVAFKIRQNPFSTGAVPRTPRGSSRRSPRPLSRLERGHPSPYSTPHGTDPPSALAMRPPEVQPDLRLWGYSKAQSSCGGCSKALPTARGIKQYCNERIL